MRSGSSAGTGCEAMSRDPTPVGPEGVVRKERIAITMLNPSEAVAARRLRDTCIRPLATDDARIAEPHRCGLLASPLARTPTPSPSGRRTAHPDGPSSSSSRVPVPSCCPASCPSPDAASVLPGVRWAEVGPPRPSDGIVRRRKPEEHRLGRRPSIRIWGTFPHHRGERRRMALPTAVGRRPLRSRAALCVPFPRPGERGGKHLDLTPRCTVCRLAIA